MLLNIFCCGALGINQSCWGPLRDGEEYLPGLFHLVARSWSIYPPTPLCHLLQTAPQALSSWCGWPALTIGLIYFKGQRMPSGRRLPVLDARSCEYIMRMVCAKGIYETSVVSATLVILSYCFSLSYMYLPNFCNKMKCIKAIL